MKVIEPNDNELILRSSAITTRVIMVVIIASSVYLGVKLARHSLPLLIVFLVMMAWSSGKILFGSKSIECRFDREIGQLICTRKEVGSTKTFTISFADIEKVAHREMTLKENTIYEIIITSRSRKPLIVGSTNDLVQYEHVVQRIKAMIGKDPMTRDRIEGPLVVSESITPEEEEKLE